jgi:hypothetical protein
MLCIITCVHSLIRCSLYIKSQTKATEVAPSFIMFNDREKLNFLLSDPTMIRMTAQACHDMLVKRLNILPHFNSVTNWSDR